MILEALRAAIIGGIPVAVFTFLVVQWTIASGRRDKLSRSGDLEEQHEASAERISKGDDRDAAVENGDGHREHGSRRVGDTLHRKLVSFGGGYYGTMAALTYVLIEGLEIWQFLLSLADPETWARQLGLDLLIGFLVNSLTNFISAILWFATLPKYISVHDGWIWLAVTYAAYWCALQLTLSRGDELWQRLRSLLDRRGTG